MGTNPFPDRPPKYIRTVLYRYHFASGDTSDDKYDENIDYNIASSENIHCKIASSENIHYNIASRVSFIPFISTASHCMYNKINNNKKEKKNKKNVYMHIDCYCPNLDPPPLWGADKNLMLTPGQKADQ